MEEYLLFVGQNASTGTPNKRTGHMSFFGRYLKFATKEERQDFIDEKTGFSCREIVKAGTRNTLRKYDLGCSLNLYNESLDNLDYISKVDGSWV